MKGGGGCIWQFGNDIPGEISNFGQNGQFGTLTPLDFTNPGGSILELLRGLPQHHRPTHARRHNAATLRAFGRR